MTAPEPTLDELIEMRRDAAIIVQRFGDRFMPIFDRLEREVSNRLERQNAIERAIGFGVRSS